MERLEGMTIAACVVVDQAQLIGLIKRTRELGLEPVSVEQARPEETRLGFRDETEHHLDTRPGAGRSGNGTSTERNP
jgi:hypothetical protein